MTDAVITHNHADRTGGVMTLRRDLSKQNANALARVHVAQGIFLSRAGSDGREANGLLPLKAQYEALGGRFIEHASPTRLAPGVWLTGPVPRTYGLGHLLGVHCTGIEAVFRIRQAADLGRQTAVVGAVGSSFTLGAGLDARMLAR